MKQKPYLLLLLLLTSTIALMAQNAPQGFNYQAIVRDNGGTPLANQTVSLLFAIRSGAPNAPVSYSEKQVVATNDYGLVNLVVGQGGTVIQGTFAGINWGNSAKYLSIALEVTTNVFDDLGTTQLLSVPYALYAQSAANGGGGGGDNWGTQTVVAGPELDGAGTIADPLGIAQQGATNGQVLKWNGTSWAPSNDQTTGGGGTVTQINTGTGLTGGPVTTSGTISLANTSVAPGTYGNAQQIPVITVDATGRITTATTVSIQGGGSIGLTGGTGINIQQVGNTYTITNTGDLDPSNDVTNTSQAGGDLNGPFANLQLNAGVVGTTELADNAVNSAKILDGAVGTADLADNAVNSAKILDGTVGTADLADNAVNSAKIIDGAVGTADLADNAVNSGKIASNAVTSSKLADGAVTASKLSGMGAGNGQVIKWNASLGTWEPADDNTGGAGSVNLSSGTGISVSGTSPNFTITNTGDTNAADDLTINSMAGGDLNGPFSNMQLKGNVVTPIELADNAVETVKIATGAVTGTKIAQSGATSGQVLKWNGTTWAPAADNTGGAGGTITLLPGVAIDVINNGNNNYTISNAGDIDPFDDITINSLAGGDLSGTFPNLQIYAFAVTNPELSNNSVNTNNIINGAVTGAKIAQAGATLGQVIKWNGTTWAPAADQAGVGDNWGTQTASANATISGNGTLASPLGIAQQGATNGQILKWNGTAWAPSADNDTGDNWGTQTVTTGTELTGNGTAGMPLHLAPQGATSGQVLKWNGTTWAPSADNDTGDDWGTQTVQVNTALTGNGTTANKLDLAQQGATNGQVLKWNGTTWAPANDIDTGDNWGAQTAVVGAALTGNGTGGSPLNLASQGASSGQVLRFDGANWVPGGITTNTELSGNGTIATPLRLAQQSAMTGQVLKWDGVNWTPSADLGSGTGDLYAAGTGISITGIAPNFTITNTGDGDSDPINEIQALTILGNTVSLSNGGGSIALPASNTYAAGAGLTVSGSAPNFTMTNTGDLSNTNEIQTLSLMGANLSLSPGGGMVDLSGLGGGGNNYMAGSGISITGIAPNFTISNTGDADNSLTNEIQMLSIMGNNVSLSNGGGTIALPATNTYTAGTGIGITGSAPNFTIENLGDADNSPANELQTLSLMGTQLSLSNMGGTVDLSGLGGGSLYWDPAGNDIFSNNTGSVLIGDNSGPMGKLHVRANTGTGIYVNADAGPALIAETGRVGIGTLAPASLLHVKGQAEMLRLEGTGAQLSLISGGASTTGGFLSIKDTSLVLGTANPAYDIVLAPANNLAMAISSGTGNVGVGAANDGPAKLKVTHGSNGLMLENNSSGHFWEMWVDDGPGNLFLYNDQSGFIPAGFFAPNGMYTPSDRRLKKDISGIGPVTNRLKQLQAVNYRLKEQSGTTPLSLGFIAQDVFQLFPELTSAMPARDGNTYLSVNYAGFSVVAVKAIQEQQAVIEQLQQENTNMKSQLEQIEARLKKIEDK
ncbi:MAG: tail fiber domain-containing protein [Lewinellaceae bacterium]|nr:tail fiber domain-containing protein [Lewinellaceae bacterium]